MVEAGIGRLLYSQYEAFRGGEPLPTVSILRLHSGELEQKLRLLGLAQNALDHFPVRLPLRLKSGRI
jgi:hypothetical protein